MAKQFTVADHVDALRTAETANINAVPSNPGNELIEQLRSGSTTLTRFQLDLASDMVGNSHSAMNAKGGWFGWAGQLLDNSTRNTRNVINMGGEFDKSVNTMATAEVTAAANIAPANVEPPAADQVPHVFEPQALDMAG